MALATLSIDIEARLAKLEQGMTQATRVAERNAAAIERRYAKIGDSVKSVAGVIAGAFSAKLFIDFTKGIVQGLDALVDLKDATGSSVENLSALEDIAARTGTNFEGVGSAVIKLNKALLEAKPGSETALILQKIGLDAEKLKKLDPAQALLEVAQALGTFADSGNKGRIVYQLLGKSTQELGKFLADLGKEQKLVATVTTEQAEQAEKLNNQFSAMAKNTTDAARAIVGDMIPALNKFLEVILDLKRRGGIFEGINQQLIANFESAKLTKLTAEITSLQQVIDRLGTSPGRAARMKELQAEFDETQKRAMAASDALKRFGALTPEEEASQKRGGRRPPNEGGGKFLGITAPDTSNLGGAPKAAEIAEAQRALSSYIDRLEGQRQKLLELSEEEKALTFLKELGTTGQIPQVRELVLQLAAELDQRRDLQEMTKLQADANKEIAQQAAAAARAVDDLLESTPGNRLERLLDTEGKLNERFKEGRVTAEQFREALELLDKAFDDLSPSVEDTLDEMSEFSKEAARNIQDALGDTILRTLKGDFESIGDLWVNMIERMVAEALAANLAKALMGDFGTSGKLGGLVGDFLGLFAAKGGAFSGGVQQFASGGVVNSPRLFRFAGGTGMMGEAGPEAIMPLRRGRDGKLGVSAEGGGGMTIINNVAAGVTRSEVLTALQLTAQSLRSEFKQSLRAAGVA
jgi:hypothetical protein